MRILKLAFMALPLMLVSCAEKYMIEGTSSQVMLDGKMAYIKQIEFNSPVAIDSCEVLHGRFTMSGPLDSIMCVSLFMGDDNCIPLVLERGDVRISFANSNIKVEGTPLNDILYSFLTSRDSLSMQLAELPMKESRLYIQGFSPDEVFEELGRQEAELNYAIDRLETKFIMDNINNVLGVTWFMQLCYDAYARFGFPTTTPQIDEIYGRAPESFRNNPEVVNFMKLVNNK